MSNNWSNLFKQLKMDSDTIVFEKKSFTNNELLKHLSGGVVAKTHIYVRSDVTIELEDYIRAHELCHHYLIFDQGYYYYLDEAGTEDPLFSLIMSFSHHFTINKILLDCGFDINLWHETQQKYCHRAALEGFSSRFDAIGKTLNLIELDHWLQNKSLSKLKSVYIKHAPFTEPLFKFAETTLKDLLLTNNAYKVEGAREILTHLHYILKLPKCNIYYMQVHSLEI